MPRKMGTNPKAEAARERKDEVKKAKNAAATKAQEDAKWTDEGSTATEKRRLEKIQKDLEDAKKRAEKKALAAKEAAETSTISAKGKLPNAEKITRAQLLRQADEQAEARRVEAERLRMEQLNLVAPLEPQLNLNRQASNELAKDIAEFGAENVIHASGVDSVLTQVGGGALTQGAASSSSGAAAIDQHPEKRMKSAFAEYEERQMPIVRAENPRLKLSQYKQIIFKNWAKAPENPFNIRKVG